MDKRLNKFNHVWHNKPVLRAIYKDYYDRILNECCAGTILEVGGGSGNLKEYSSSVISLDILYAPWLDLLADAHRLPFEANSFNNIVLFDVLHHLQQPKVFFSEVARIIKPNGRLIILEPGITPISWLFYNFLHQEPVDMSVDPFVDSQVMSGDDPYDSNQAIPTLIFGKYKSRLKKDFPRFKIIKNELLSLFAYPLSGGFKPWSLIPQVAVTPLLKLENKLPSIIFKLMAFRLFVSIEVKKQD